jgi:large subunit ribosomal protein L10
MARTKKQKKLMVEKYKEQIANSKALFVLEPSGLNANQAVAIKKQLVGYNASYNVVKNSLFTRALTENNMKLEDENFENPKGIVFTSEQVSESAKVISEFLKVKENKDSIKVLFGFLDKKQISAEKVQELANLPTRDVLLAQVLATMKAPISGFVNVLAGNMRKVLYLLNAIKEQKAA